MSFVIPLSRRGGRLSRQVYEGLRDAILAGALRSGERLPSTRSLADELGISRTVVLLAYEQLLAEGFAVGRAGSGTYVTDAAAARPPLASNPVKPHLSRFGAAAAEAWRRVDVPPRPPRPLPYDFVYGRSDLETFPFEAWRRLLLRSARRAPVAELDYGAAGGHPRLREAIAAHLRRSRAVRCHSDQVMIVNGSQQAIDLVVRALVERGDRVAIEDPAYQGARETLRVAGAELVPVPVDRHGIDPSKLPAGARLAFVTPSHQFPTGAVLPLGRRVALLDWATRTGAILVEDDYDGEFRYAGQPVESLQGLDREGRVVYLGTFSRTVFSALRIGYLVAPPALVPVLTAVKWLSDRHTATLEQQTLAAFIASGAYERYLRRVRRRNASRRTVLLASIERHLGDRVAVTGDTAGAHVVVWPRRRVREAGIVAAAAERGVAIYGVSPYFIRRPPRPGFLLGYSRLSESEIREGIRRLAQVF